MKPVASKFAALAKPRPRKRLEQTRQAIRLPLLAGLMGGAICGFLALIVGEPIVAAAVFAGVIALSIPLALMFGTLGLIADGAIATSEAVKHRREIRTREQNPIAGAVALASESEGIADGALSEPERQRGEVSSVERDPVPGTS